MSKSMVPTIAVLTLLIFAFTTFAPVMQTADSWFGLKCWAARVKCQLAWQAAVITCAIANRYPDVEALRKACIASIKYAKKVCKKADEICD